MVVSCVFTRFRSDVIIYVYCVVLYAQFWKEFKGEHRTKTPELLDSLQRPHSSVDHYPTSCKRTDFNANHQNILAEDVRETGAELLRPSISSTNSSVGSNCDSNGNNSSICSVNNSGGKMGEFGDTVDVHAKQSDVLIGKEDANTSCPPSRKVSQDKPRLDKSRSTPAYESLDCDMASFEEKLKEIKARKQSQLEEAINEHVVAGEWIALTNFHCDIELTDDLCLFVYSEESPPPLSPKPALPPRNKLRQSVEKLTVNAIDVNDSTVHCTQNSLAELPALVDSDALLHANDTQDGHLGNY